MGYDLHITRADDWRATAGHEISSTEWVDLLADDTDLNPDPEYGPFAAYFGARHLDRWFDWYDGNIYTTNPDPRGLAKMLQIAERLGARVQGDHGEPYVSAEQCPVE